MLKLGTCGIEHNLRKQIFTIQGQTGYSKEDWMNVRAKFQSEFDRLSRIDWDAAWYYFCMAYSYLAPDDHEFYSWLFFNQDYSYKAINFYLRELQRAIWHCDEKIRR